MRLWSHLERLVSRLLDCVDRRHPASNDPPDRHARSVNDAPLHNAHPLARGWYRTPDATTAVATVAMDRGLRCAPRRASEVWLVARVSVRWSWPVLEHS